MKRIFDNVSGWEYEISDEHHAHISSIVDGDIVAAVKFLCSILYPSTEPIATLAESLNLCRNRQNWGLPEKPALTYIDKASELKGQVKVLQQELENMKHIASELASYHAANAEYLTKSTSKREKNRRKEICRRAVAYLRGKEFPRLGLDGDKAQQIEWDIARCERVVDKP